MLQLSYSAIRDFYKCPMKFLLSRLFEPQILPDPMQFGVDLMRSLEGSYIENRLIIAYRDLIKSVLPDNVKYEQEATKEFEGFTLIGKADILGDGWIGEIKFTTKSLGSIYMESWAKEQLEFYSLLFPNIEWFYLLPVYRKKPKNEEDFEKLLDRIQRRPGEFLPYLRKNSELWGFRFHRDEFNKEALEQKLTVLYKTILLRLKYRFFEKSYACAFSSCLYEPICQAVQTIEDIFEIEHPHFKKRQENFEKFAKILLDK